MNMQIMHLVLIAIRLFHIVLEHVMQSVQQHVFLAMLMATRLWLRSRRRGAPTAGIPRPDLPTLLLTALVGVLLHGVYLGSVFFALSVGLSAGISALIVSLQPILASFLAIFLFAGIIKGFLGIGLPAAAMAFLTLVMDPTIAISLLTLPIIFTNIMQYARCENG